MDKSVKEIADELGIDKQKVYRFIKKNHINEVHHEAHQKNGVLMYDEAAQTLIFSAFGCIKEPHQNHINDTVNEAVISMLQKELEIKNGQIEAQQQTITELTAALRSTTESLQAAQALHAGTIRQQISDGGADPAEPEQPPKKKGWKFWK